MPIQQQDTIGDLTKLIGLVKGPTTSQSTSSNISKEGMQSLINQILGGSQGLATIAQGQKAAGLYGSTTNQMLQNDLITQTSQKLAAAQAGTTQVSKTSPPISSQNLMQMLTLFAGTKLLGPTVKKGIKATGLDDAGDKLANTLFPGSTAGAGTGTGSVSSLANLTDPLDLFTANIAAGGTTQTALDSVVGASGGSVGAGFAGVNGAIDASGAAVGASDVAGLLTAANATADPLGAFIGSLGFDAVGAGAGSAAGVAAGVAGDSGILASIGSAIGDAIPFLASLFSDERLKTDIKPVGETKEGQTIYTYKFKTDPFRTHMGVMAQETLKLHPEAVSVHKPSGALMVNYDKILGVD